MAQGQPKEDAVIHYHGLGVEGLYTALEESENPILAFAASAPDDGNFSNRICLVTGMKKDGRHVVVFADLDETGLRGGKAIRANKDVTVYDDKSVADLIRVADSQNKILYVDKKRSSEIAGLPAYLITPGAMQTSGFEKNIQDFWNNVKWKKANARRKGDTSERSFAFGEASEKTALRIAFERAQREKATNVRNSLSDAEYLELAKDPEKNRDQLQRTVRATAEQAGYTTPDLYHGTPSFGFTAFRDNAHETPFIYTSTKREVAAHYAGDNNYAFVRDIGKAYRNGDSIEDIIHNAKQVYGAD